MSPPEIDSVPNVAPTQAHGVADRLVMTGFSKGAERLMQAMQDSAGGTDDRGLVLIWRK